MMPIGGAGVVLLFKTLVIHPLLPTNLVQTHLRVVSPYFANGVDLLTTFIPLPIRSIYFGGCYPIAATADISVSPLVPTTSLRHL